MTDDHDDASRLTVGQLRDLLAAYPADLPVVVVYDCGCAEGVVVNVTSWDGAVELVVN